MICFEWLAVGLCEIRNYDECFSDNVPIFLIQPRAAYSARLSHLRSLVGNRGEWSFRGGDEPDLLKVVRDGLGGGDVGVGGGALQMVGYNTD